ncbi:MAG TPA: metallophosphoesterase [Phycisphaerae bacterium]|nr:metallophosphoesterase [Phycisphaerae bacterium]
MLFNKAISALDAVAELNRNDPLRNGQMLCFPGSGDLFVAGDLHNHARNFERFRTVAALDKNPDRHVILQELIHGGALGANGEDRSMEMLIHACEWARHFPGRVHFLLANHDMAQVQRLPIMKDGYDLTDRFNRYLEHTYRGDAERVQNSFRNFVYSMPLAAITVTGLFLTHSLPDARVIGTFDQTLLRRDLTEADYARNGPIYQLIWGRNQNQEVFNILGRAWWADLFICGHQAQDEGYGVIGDRMLIIDSSHNHGVFLRIDLTRQYTLQDLIAQIIPLAAIA